MPERVSCSRFGWEAEAELPWSDPADSRWQEEALAAEGVRFQNGAADAAQRLDSGELELLLTRVGAESRDSGTVV